MARPRRQFAERKHRQTGNPAFGYTLVELMVTLSVLGIITALAVPQYVNYMQKSRRADAIISIQNMLAKQTLYRANFGGGYTSDVKALGFPRFENGDNKTPSDDGHYILTVAACDATTRLTECVKISAAPKAGGKQADDRCKVFEMNTRGKRHAQGSDPDNPNDSPEVITEECWQ